MFCYKTAETIRSMHQSIILGVQTLNPCNGNHVLQNVIKTQSFHLQSLKSVHIPAAVLATAVHVPRMYHALLQNACLPALNVPLQNTRLPAVLKQGENHVHHQHIHILAVLQKVTVSYFNILFILSSRGHEGVQFTGLVVSVKHKKCKFLYNIFLKEK